MQSVMQELSNTAAKVNQMLRLLSNVHKCDFHVDNRKKMININLSSQVLDEVQTYDTIEHS